MAGRWSGLTGVVVALAAACAGRSSQKSSITEEPSGGAAGNGGSAGAVMASAGASGASAGSGGAPAGSAGSAGVAGGTASPCEPDPSGCSVSAYAFDPATGRCQTFDETSCSQTANHFFSLGHCVAWCQSPAAVTACERPSDCVLVPSQCCPSCWPDISAFVAVNERYARDFQDRLVCLDIECAPCNGPTDPPVFFGAKCVAGRCEAYDLGFEDAASCSEPEDCGFRFGLACCEPCEGSLGTMVAINKNYDATELFCGDTPITCETCPTPRSYPARADCSPDEICIGTVDQ
jgi:hypothetical protein